MKAIITVLAVLFVTGAFAQKNTNTISQAPITQKGVKGVVSHFEGKECDFYITANVNGHDVKYYPINLPAEFDVDGKKIIFDFVTTTDRIDEACVVSAISVSNVKNQKTTSLSN